MIESEYVKDGPVISLTGAFAVLKGESDIRIVYDANKCGLNKTPLFPSIDTVLRQTPLGGWMGDIDLGEQFLMFALDEKLRPYVRIDVTQMRG